MEEEWMDGRWDGGWRGRDGGVSGVLGTELKLELSMGLGKARRANDECDQCCLADSATSVTRSLFEDCTCARRIRHAPDNQNRGLHSAMPATFIAGTWLISCRAFEQHISRVSLYAQVRIWWASSAKATP